MKEMSYQHIKPNVEKALFFAKRQLAELVCDAVNLEGIHYTLPEVQTLLEGITVGGHKLSDERITLNQAAAWRSLFNSIEEKNFSLDKSYACQLHAIAARKEALRWGQFREGSVTIAGSTYLPPAAGQLTNLWESMLVEANAIKDVYYRAIFIFLTMARTQFFYDVNKRMGRFMMNGLLISQGYPAINLPAKRQLDFNRLMLTFYDNGDMQNMTEFMLSCLSSELLQIMLE
jgi:Fic family protein